MDKKFNEVYQFDDRVPVVDKSVDASWLKPGQENNFTIPRGT